MVSKTTAAPFQRRQLPLPVRYAMGAILRGVMLPAAHGMEALGWGEKMMANAFPRQYKQWAKQNPFGAYQPDEHDVIVATYPKSGTNWMMQIVHQLAFHGKTDFDHIHSVVAWPDAYPQLGKYAIPVNDPSVWMASPERKRAIKTHLNWELIPYTAEARYIMVIRDPKEVFVSNYFFLNTNPDSPMVSRELWYRLFITGKLPVGGPWAESTAGYWAQRHRPNVLVLSFKDMKRDLAGTVRQVADFMNVDVSDDILDAVCGQCTFEAMKRIDEKFSVWQTVPWAKPNTMVRKGKQGGSSELLSIDEQREIDSHFQAQLQRLNCDLPYAEFCDLA